MWCIGYKWLYHTRDGVRKRAQFVLKVLVKCHKAGCGGRRYCGAAMGAGKQANLGWPGVGRGEYEPWTVKKQTYQEKKRKTGKRKRERAKQSE